MRKVRIGKILLVDGGEWSSTQGYGKLVYVTHNGDGYWSVRDNINSEPKAGSLDWIKATNVQPFIDAVRKETSDAKTINEQITAAESLRVEKELERINAEIQRAKNEQERIIKENARVNDESIRVQSETERVNAELQRKTDEDKRKQDFTSFMTTSANTFAEKENERKQTFETNEAGRVNSETERQMRFEQKITECQSATDLANTKALEAQNAANAATAATASCNEASQNAQAAAENAFTVAEAIQNSFVQNEAARQETFNESQRSRTNAFELAESGRQQAFQNSETTRQQTFDSKEAKRDQAIEEVKTYNDRLSSLETQTSSHDHDIDAIVETRLGAPDYNVLPLLCGQPPILFGAGTPQKAIVPINWRQFDPETGEGYNWNGLPSAIGQQYINTSVDTGGRYIAIPGANGALAWKNM